MLDNIDLKLSKEQSGGADFLQSVPNCLTSIKSRGVTEYGEYVTGYLGKLKVSVTENRVKIFDSSLCKDYLGDNFKTLSKSDGRREIEKISDLLHLPFQNADVSRIDLAQNFIMQYPEKVYYSYLGEAKYYSRLEQNNGLYYQNNKRTLLFYGKVHEQKIKQQPIPELYQNKHVLRYELRFLKGLCKEFNLSELKAYLLYDEVFYNNLVKRWRDEYLWIQKISTKLNTMKATGSKKQFIENLALFTILELGQPSILGKVKEWQATGEISKKQAFELRQSVKEICTIPENNEVQNDLINELTRKVKEAARY